MINIQGKIAVVDDAYRYKMSEVKCNTESSGNGIKTAFTNYKDISMQLERSPEELHKFIDYNLHTRSEIMYDRLLINGCFNKKQLQSCIYTYIETFVLCDVCRLPEIVYRYKKNDLLYKCRSCGHRDIIFDKLSKYIIKQHKKIKKTHHKKDKISIEQNTNDEIVDDSEIIWFSDLSEEAIAQRASENPLK